jgi:hypothetical protein
LPDLYEIAQKKNYKIGKYRFYRDPREWVCLCCGNLRVMLRGKPICVKAVEIDGTWYNKIIMKCGYGGGHSRVLDTNKDHGCPMIWELQNIRNKAEGLTRWQRRNEEHGKL